MRRRLRNQEHFAPLRDELDFIEDYLSIELVRFGDKLRVLKHIDPSALDMLVPSMLLQPLVENSIKHGISGKIDGGTITLRARRDNDRLVDRSGRRWRGHSGSGAIEYPKQGYRREQRERTAESTL